MPHVDTVLTLICDVTASQFLNHLTNDATDDHYLHFKSTVPVMSQALVKLRLNTDGHTMSSESISESSAIFWTLCPLFLR